MISSEFRSVHADLGPLHPRAPRLVAVAWGLLLVNVLGYAAVETVFPFPETTAQIITMSSLAVAFALALTANPRVQIRPSAYLVLLSLLLVESLASSLRLESGPQALLRCARLALFVATLWLLSRWWGRGLTFVRSTVAMLVVFLLTVVAGLVVSPADALWGDHDRLVGALWPMYAPQVGQFGAVLTGLVVLMWLTEALGGVSALLLATASITLMLLSHTRTAAVGLVLGLLVACASLAARNVRYRRALVFMVATSAVGVMFFGTALLEWFQRGQDEDQFENLTGREVVWDSLLSAKRTVETQLFGVGLSDKSFAGAAVDNSWLSVYHEQGLLGVVLVGAIMAVVVGTALLRPPSPGRAYAVFLISFCALSSYTEVGLGDASPYLLYLTLAASLLVPSDARTAGPEAQGGMP